LVSSWPITDAVLAHRGLADALTEVLGNVRQALRADTIAILLVSDDGQHLAEQASVGLPPEMHRSAVQLNATLARAARTGGQHGTNDRRRLEVCLAPSARRCARG